jgi:hypothetical protein
MYSEEGAEDDCNAGLSVWESSPEAQQSEAWASALETSESRPQESAVTAEEARLGVRERERERDGLVERA